MEETLGNEYFLCSFCPRIFENKSCLIRHEAYHSEVEERKALTSSISEIDECLTISTIHKALECGICYKIFTSNNHLKRHMKIHRRILQCPLCPKTFPYSCFLEKHLRSHKEEKPYQCEVCKKRFSENGNLKRHLRIHNEEKSFECEICSKTFTEKGTLDRHVRTHTGEKPYSCEVCQKEFSDLANFNHHKSSHQIPNIKCPSCDRLFKTNRYLKKHMKVHLLKRPAVCSSCSKTFKSFAYLQRHKCIKETYEPSREVLNEEMLQSNTFSRILNPLNNFVLEI